MPTLLTLSLFFSSLFAVSFGAVFTSGTPDTVTVRGAYSAPALSFSSNADFTITQFSQYLSPNSASNFLNGVVFIADLYSQEILFTSEEFSLSNAGAGWYNSPQLNWNLDGSATQYSIGLMVDVPASYYYTVSETNTDGTLTSYFDNGNFEGNFDSADFTCCGEINLFSSITYSTSTPNSNSTTFTAGNSTSYSYRGYYDASALNFRANKNVYLTQVAQYIDPQGYSIGYVFQGMVVLANLNTTSVIYNSPVFNLTVNGAGFYSSPNINVEIDPTIEYAVGIITNIYADYYYGYGIQTDGTLTAYPSNANIAGSFTSQTISCCAAATIYMQLTYTSSEDNAKNFSSGGTIYSNYRAAFDPAALNFKANTEIVITQVSQYISPQVTTGTPIGAMVVVGNLNSSTIEYNSPIFTLYAAGPTWYTSPSVYIPLFGNTNYVIAIMTNVSTNIYYTLDSGNTDGTITSYSRNANFIGNFNSQSIDCCYSADIATQFLYTAGTPPPPPSEYTFVSGDETYTSYRAGFFAAALNFVTNTPITIDQVSQYLEPSLGNIAAIAIIANLNTSEIIYNSPTVVLANNGSSWYSIPVNFPVYPGVNYGIGIMLNVSNTIFYSGTGNTDGTITSFAHNANFGGNFGNQTIDCCYGANIYTQIVYSENSENVITQIEEVFKRFNSFDR